MNVRADHEHPAAAHRPAAVGDGAHQARPVAAVRQHARHAVLPRRGLRAVLQGRNTPAATRRCATRCASTSSTPSSCRAARATGASAAACCGSPAIGNGTRSRCYVLVPLDGEPTLIYSMGGTHAEAVRRQVEVAVKDVRHSRNGRYADSHGRAPARAEARARPHRPDGDRPAPRRLPAGQPVQRAARRTCPTPSSSSPRASCTSSLSIHSDEELDCVRKAGVLCEDAMEAMVARAKPGVKEYELRAAAGAAILEGGGDIDFLIIGSTPMDNPAHDLRQSAPVRPRAQEGRHHQHGACRRLSRLHRADRLADLPRRADRHGAQVLGGDHAARLPAGSSPRSRPASRPRAMRQASKFFRDNGVQSRPTQCHGIDLVTDKPHVSRRARQRRRRSSRCSSPAW